MKLYNINELKDSKIFFDKNPPPFLLIFLWFCFFLLILTIIGTNFITKSYVVKGQGQFIYEDRTYITPPTNGEIKDVYVKEGDFVEKNQVVISLSSKVENLQVENYRNQLEQENKKLEIFQLFEKSLNDNFNYLTKDEKEYYEKFIYYIFYVNDDSKNEKKRKDDISKLNIELAELENQEYTLGEIEKVTVREQIKNKQKEIQKLLEQENNQALAIKNQLLTEVGSKTTETKDKIIQLSGQIDMYSLQGENLNLKASSSGYVHYLVSVDKGNSIQGLQPIVEIQGDKNAKLVVEGQVDAIDRSKINLGDDVLISLDGVNRTKFGTINGKITKIDNGVLMQKYNDSIKPYYKILVDISDTSLKASDGTEIKIINSMLNEINILYEKESYFDWIMNQLNFMK